MTMPVISNPFGTLRVDSVRDLSLILFSKEGTKDTKLNNDRRPAKTDRVEHRQSQMPRMSFRPDWRNLSRWLKDTLDAAASSPGYSLIPDAPRRDPKEFVDSSIMDRLNRFFVAWMK